MRQKEALKKVEAYCSANGMKLLQASFTRNLFAIAIIADKPTGNTLIEWGVPCRPISGFRTPAELLTWIDGYNAGGGKK